MRSDLPLPTPTALPYLRALLFVSAPGAERLVETYRYLPLHLALPCLACVPCSSLPFSSKSSHSSNFFNSRQQMDGENKLKKRGRDIEEESYSSGTPTAKKQETCYHNNNNNNNTNEDDLSRREELEVHNLKVFDFPWLHEEEGMMCESENLFNLEDTFSSTLNHPTHCSITIAGPGADVPQFEFSADTFSAAFVPSALDDKFEMWPLDAVGDHDALQTDGADCIWAPLLNQPLQHTLSS